MERNFFAFFLAPKRVYEWFNKDSFTTKTISDQFSIIYYELKERYLNY